MSGDENGRRATVKGPWKAQEDQLLMKLIDKHGTSNWSVVARGLPGRNGKSCRLRWFNQLTPAIKKGSFSAQEDALIVQAHSLMGNKWSRISHIVVGRTDNAIKNRWNSTLKRKLKLNSGSEKGKGRSSALHDQAEPVSVDELLREMDVVQKLLRAMLPELETGSLKAQMMANQMDAGIIHYLLCRMRCGLMPSAAGTILEGVKSEQGGGSEELDPILTANSEMVMEQLRRRQVRNLHRSVGKCDSDPEPDFSGMDAGDQAEEVEPKPVLTKEDLQVDEQKAPGCKPAQALPVLDGTDLSAMLATVPEMEEFTDAIDAAEGWTAGEHWTRSADVDQKRKQDKQQPSTEAPMEVETGDHLDPLAVAALAMQEGLPLPGEEAPNPGSHHGSSTPRSLRSQCSEASTFAQIQTGDTRGLKRHCSLPSSFNGSATPSISDMQDLDDALPPDFLEALSGPEFECPGCMSEEGDALLQFGLGLSVVDVRGASTEAMVHEQMKHLEQMTTADPSERAMDMDPQADAMQVDMPKAVTRRSRRTRGPSLAYTRRSGHKRQLMES
ncbi:hypothetical protein WJX73_001986 [Symbiochloris irregularis]|uniref:Uncharacterized protein n=1 Tax=Symbiochloris irregularis TaxID=706552 RepID=A0AAW1NW36_9CHLO